MHFNHPVLVPFLPAISFSPHTESTVLTQEADTRDKNNVFLAFTFGPQLFATALSEKQGGTFMNRLRILVADDHEIVRRGLISLIKAHPDWEVCAEANNGREAIEKAVQTKPDIAILDIGMPVLNGLEATRNIVRENPNIRVLILTITDTDQAVQAVLDAGARGFLLKSDAARDLVTALEALQHDKTFFTARVADLVLAGFLNKTPRTFKAESSHSALTSREREVVQLLAEGKSTKEVACHLDLSVKTAETHRSNIMRKLGLHSVGELVLYAVRNSIVQVPGGILAPSPATLSESELTSLKPASP